MIKWLPWILFCCSLLAAVYSFALLLNAGGALDDARSEVERLRERSDLALVILRKNWLGTEVTSLSTLSKDLRQQGVIVKNHEGVYEIGDIVFETKGGLIKDLRYFD